MFSRKDAKAKAAAKPAQPPAKEQAAPKAVPRPPPAKPAPPPMRPAQPTPKPALELGAQSNLVRYVEQLDSIVKLNRAGIDELKSDVSEIKGHLKEMIVIFEEAQKQYDPFAPQEAALAPEMAEQQPQQLQKQKQRQATATTTAPPLATTDLVVEGVTAAHMAATAPQHLPLLRRLPTDQLGTVIVLRWLEFLLQRNRRDNIPMLFDYYVQVGWISGEAREELIDYIRGEIPDITQYEPEPTVFNNLDEEEEADDHVLLKDVDDWRMTPEDHLKSYLFLQRIIGNPIDRNELNQVELEIKQFKGRLKDYYGL